MGKSADLPTVVSEIRQVSVLKSYSIQYFETSRRLIESKRSHRTVNWLTQAIFNEPKLPVNERVTPLVVHRAQYFVEECLVRLYLDEYLSGLTMQSVGELLKILRWQRHPEIVEKSRRWVLKKVQKPSQVTDFLDNELNAETYRNYGSLMYDRKAHPGKTAEEIAGAGIDLSVQGSFLHALGESIEASLAEVERRGWDNPSRFFMMWVFQQSAQLPVANPWCLMTLLDQVVALAELRRPVSAHLQPGVSLLGRFSFPTNPVWQDDLHALASQMAHELSKNCPSRLAVESLVPSRMK